MMLRAPDARHSDTERRIANTIRYGTIAEADYEARRVRVNVGDTVTGWIAFATGSAAGVKTWLPPEIGEQVILAAPGGDLRQATVLASVNSTGNPAPGDRPDLTRTTWQDGAEVLYDQATKDYTIQIPSGGRVFLKCGAGEVKVTNDGVEIRCGRSVMRFEDGGITLEAVSFEGVQV
jgi:phage baseplate assembly protein V